MGCCAEVVTARVATTALIKRTHFRGSFRSEDNCLIPELSWQSAFRTGTPKDDNLHEKEASSRDWLLVEACTKKTVLHISYDRLDLFYKQIISGALRGKMNFLQ